MAVTKIKPIKKTLKKSLDYIQQEDKTDGKVLVSSFGCSSETADIEFSFTLSQAIEKGNNLAHHLIQSFSPGEVEADTAHEIGRQLADAVTKGRHEYVLTTHIDKGHVHNHIIFCAVDMVHHRKYISNKRSYAYVRRTSDRLCKEYGLSVVTPEKEKGKTYAEWDAYRRGKSWKAKLKMTMDMTILQAQDFEHFVKLMQIQGYEVKRGKFLSYRAPGQERFIRDKTLGSEYLEESIKKRIEGTYSELRKTPQKQQEVSLLIDLENNIKIAQSRGYEQWAKIHNLKQAAKTLNFLSEHGIEQYEELIAKISEVQKANEQAADALKDVEKRLADMATLIKNVTTFQQTKQTQETFRNSEKQRLAEQESNMILHRAAAKALKEAGVSKLPNLAALQKEYDSLQEQKERLRVDYRKLKRKAKEYDVVKQNVDRLLQSAKQEKMDQFLER